MSICLIDVGADSVSAGGSVCMVCGMRAGTSGSRQYCTACGAYDRKLMPVEDGINATRGRCCGYDGGDVSIKVGSLHMAGRTA